MENKNNQTTYLFIAILLLVTSCNRSFYSFLFCFSLWMVNWTWLIWNSNSGNFHGMALAKEEDHCKVPSGSFQGVCIKSHNCAVMCKAEGFADGSCSTFKRKCICQKKKEECWATIINSEIYLLIKIWNQFLVKFQNAGKICHLSRPKSIYFLWIKDSNDIKTKLKIKSWS